MNPPLISEVLPDLLEEMVFLLQGTGAEPLEEQLRALRIESICDCGDDNCASFATAAEVKVEEVVELNASEGFLIIDLNQARQICFIGSGPARHQIFARRTLSEHKRLGRN